MKPPPPPDVTVYPFGALPVPPPPPHILTLIEVTPDGTVQEVPYPIYVNVTTLPKLLFPRPSDIAIELPAVVLWKRVRTTESFNATC
jgi:hypothetical protein